MINRTKIFLFITIAILILGILAAIHPKLSNFAKTNNPSNESPLQVNLWNPTGNAVCTAPYDQYLPQICSDGVGGAFITWFDRRSSSNYDIYAQRINASGVEQWTHNGLAICTKAADQESPQLCSDGAGGVIITWEDYRDGTWDIYAQRINGTGVAQWIANGTTICAATYDQLEPKLTIDGQGGAIITWFDYRRYSLIPSNIDIYAQRVNASGEVQWTTNGVPICARPSTAADLFPEICSDGHKGAIITWEDRPNYDIYAQRINANGIVNWTNNGVPICTATGYQENPRLCSDSNGGAIIEWSDARMRFNWFNVYAQRIDLSGTTHWDSNGIPICSVCNLYNGIDTAICNANGLGAVIAWNDNRSGDFNIYAQWIWWSGTVQWPANGTAICTAPNTQSAPQLCSDGTGGAIITWLDARIGNGVYAQRVASTGAMQWAIDGTKVCESSAPTPPELCTDGDQGAIIVWADFRGVNYDIYARHILPPNAPLLLDISPNPNTNGNIFLNWTKVIGAGNYSVYRSTSPFTTTTSLTPIAVISVGVTNYTDSGLTNGLYYYTIVASNATGESALSNIKSVQVALPIPGFDFLYLSVSMGLSITGLYLWKRLKKSL